MDVLVIGGGGREHALVWSLANSDSVDTVYCTPGNAGIERLAERWNIAAGNIDELTTAAVENDVDLVVVGPEAPLTAGLADRLIAEGVSSRISESTTSLPPLAKSHSLRKPSRTLHCR